MGLLLMGKKIAEFDAYIAKRADFARPILTHIRKLVHAACPAVEEAIKWGHPHFMYHGMFCGMAAFKKHCVFGFWDKELQATLKALGKNDEAMGQFGCLTSIADLPSRAAFTRLVKQAMRLNEERAKSPRKAAPKAPRKKRPPVKIPTDFLSALGKNKKAHQAFTAFSPSHQREYVEWITEAKRDETREKRMRTALEWLAAGKSRNWKYERR
jgi:uncharacterized protein YdeI (YjbR/CyaY-like superfamily)